MKGANLMQIVIDIPEDSYKDICDGYISPPDIKNIVQGIKNGTPLPMGHEDKMKVLKKIKSELWMEGMNMTGEYRGIWVRFRDIERIIGKYLAESEE